MEQRSHVLYITHLIRKGHGYPFWFPEPDSSRSVAYAERGVHPGDVGILNDIGGFDYLFNIFCDADDPVNGGNVPPDFRPLRRQTSESPRIMPACYNYNITSADVNYTEISAGVSADVTGLARAEASFEFSTTKESAAILCLPHSATKHEILSKGAIKEYATANGAAWYTYVNSSQYLGREVPNGSLYVATGCDKTDSWGIAAVGKPSHSRSVCLSFIAVGMVGGEVRAGHTWSNSFSADTRVYPLHSARYPYPMDGENQCIFARGFTISLSDSLFKSDGKTVLRNISGSLKDKIPSFDSRAPCPRLPGETGSSGRRLYFPWISHGTPPVMDNEDDLGSNADRLSDTDSDCEMSISEFPPRDSELMNPSAAMNLYLLEKDQSLDIAVTHDEEWMKIIEEFEIGGKTTDEILWGQIKDELDKRSLPPTTDSISLSTVNEAADADSDNHFQYLPNVSTGNTGSSPSPFLSSSSFPHTQVPPKARNTLAQQGLSIASAITGTHVPKITDGYIVPTGNKERSDSTSNSSGSSYGQHALSETPDLSQMSTQKSYSPAPHQHPDRGQQGSLQGVVPPDKHSQAPIPHPDLPELRRLEEVERKLAQDYGMVHEGSCIDSTAVREEASRRAKSAPEKISSSFLSFLQKDDDEADYLKLHRLYHLRTELSRLNIKIGPASRL